MPSYGFLGTADALRQDVDRFDRFDGIRGLRGIVADRLTHPPTRTEAGYARQPGEPWTAWGDRDKFKVIARVERRNGPEYGPGMCAVVYGDGSEDLFDHRDLLCVEFPVPTPVRHYGESRTACGDPVGEMDAVTTEIPRVTCRGCKKSVHATV